MHTESVMNEAVVSLLLFMQIMQVLFIYLFFVIASLITMVITIVLLLLFSLYHLLIHPIVRLMNDSCLLGRVSRSAKQLLIIFTYYAAGCAIVSAMFFGPNRLFVYCVNSIFDCAS